MDAAGRGKGRPNLAERAEIDRAIREAAMQVLREQGEAATLNAVAQVAGLSRKSVYARYPNKTELFLAVIRDQLELVTGIRYDRAGHFEDRLRNYIEAAIEVIATPGSRAIQRLLSLDPAYIAALRPQMLAATRRLFLVPLIELLRNAAQSGEAELEDAEATARMLMPMIFAESFDWDRTGDMSDSPIGRGRYAVRVAKLIARGLVPR
jgi:AcrR family transcriptional regulator